MSHVVFARFDKKVVSKFEIYIEILLDHSNLKLDIDQTTSILFQMLRKQVIRSWDDLSEIINGGFGIQTLNLVGRLIINRRNREPSSHNNLSYLKQPIELSLL